MARASSRDHRGLAEPQPVLLTMLTVHTSHLNTPTLLDSPDVMAVVDFAQTPAPRPDDPRQMVTPLGSQADLREVWTTSSGPVTSGQTGRIQYVRSGTETIGTLVLEDDGQAIETLAYRAYTELLTWLDAQPHQHLWRVWNFLADINMGDGDQERYRLFSVGRLRALRESAVPDRALPPATAIGCQAPLVYLMFIAGGQPCQPVENPRQLSAYRYPRRYGPASPSFARAARVDAGSLIVSGTASIVGHETRHPGDWARQLDETHRNLEALTAHAGVEAAPRALRAYLRPEVPLGPVVERIRARWGQHLDVIPLVGDICRTDLMLEIEGVWPLSANTAADHSAAASSAAEV